MFQIMSSKGAIFLLLAVAIAEGSRIFEHAGNVRVHNPETRRYDASSSGNAQDLFPQNNRRHSYQESSTFNPDVLNKFLEDYAKKIKQSSDKTYKPHLEGTEPPLTLGNDDDYAFATVNEGTKSTESSVKLGTDKNEVQDSYVCGYF